MLINNRPDGKPVKVPGFTKIIPYLMPTRTESTIYMTQEVDMGDSLELMREWNKSKGEGAWTLTPMQIFLCALARAIAKRPRMNRFVSNQRHYQRNNISFSFVTKKTLTDDGLEINVVMPFRPHDTLKDVNERFKRFVGTAKSDDGNKSESDVDLFDKMPHWVLKIIISAIKWMDKHNWVNKAIIRLFPFYSTVFVTNVGSIGLDAPIHHNYEIGTTGMFAALGKMKVVRELQADGSVLEKTVMPVNYAFDDRIIDGIYAGRAMNLIKKYLESPEILIRVPEISQKDLDTLNLNEKGWKLWDEMG